MSSQSMQGNVEVCGTKERPHSGRRRATARPKSAGSRSRTPPRRVASNPTAPRAGTAGCGENAASPCRATAVAEPKGAKGLVKATMDAITGNNALQTERTNRAEGRFGPVSCTPAHHRKSNKGLPVAGPGGVAVRSRKVKTLNTVEDKSLNSGSLAQAPATLEASGAGNSHSVGAMWSLTRSVQMMSAQQGKDQDQPLVVLATRSCIKSHRFALISINCVIHFCRKQI